MRLNMRLKVLLKLLNKENDKDKELKKWFEDNGFEVTTLFEVENSDNMEDIDLIAFMRDNGVKYILNVPELARSWYCRSLEYAKYYLKTETLSIDNSYSIIEDLSRDKYLRFYQNGDVNSEIKEDEK